MYIQGYTTNGSAARTLSADEVRGDGGAFNENTGVYSLTHKDGWTISGAISEDYYEWVNDFEASHPVFGRVWGNFEDIVYATSERAFEHFVRYHEPESWDYYDI